MKCKFVRHHLLASERPARPPAMVADHLAHCTPCRDWQRQLVRIERLVPELPVPPSSAMSDCLHAVLHSEAYGRNGKGEVEWQRRERALRKVAITFAMAAGLLFFALIWYAWQQQRDGQWANPGSQLKGTYTVESIIKKYGGGEPLPADPSRRLDRMAAVAKILHSETTKHVQSGTIDEVTALARQFEVLVQEGILPQAHFVPAEDRAQILDPLADQLSRAESDANRLATQRADVSQPLLHMAFVAKKGQVELRSMSRG